MSFNVVLGDRELVALLTGVYKKLFEVLVAQGSVRRVGIIVLIGSVKFVCEKGRIISFYHNELIRRAI